MPPLYDYYVPEQRAKNVWQWLQAPFTKKYTTGLEETVEGMSPYLKAPLSMLIGAYLGKQLAPASLASQAMTAGALAPVATDFFGGIGNYGPRTNVTGFGYDLDEARWRMGQNPNLWKYGLGALALAASPTARQLAVPAALGYGAYKYGPGLARGAYKGGIRPAIDWMGRPIGETGVKPWQIGAGALGLGALSRVPGARGNLAPLALAGALGYGAYKALPGFKEKVVDPTGRFIGRTAESAYDWAREPIGETGIPKGAAALGGLGLLASPTLRSIAGPAGLVASLGYGGYKALQGMYGPEAVERRQVSREEKLDMLEEKFEEGNMTKKDYNQYKKIFNKYDKGLKKQGYDFGAESFYTDPKEISKQLDFTKKKEDEAGKGIFATLGKIPDFVGENILAPLDKYLMDVARVYAGTLPRRTPPPGTITFTPPTAPQMRPNYLRQLAELGGTTGMIGREGFIPGISQPVSQTQGAVPGEGQITEDFLQRDYGGYLEGLE